MMEYQRFIRNHQIERAKKLLKNPDPETYKKGLMMSHVSSKELPVRKTGKQLQILTKLIRLLSMKKKGVYNRNH